MTIIMPTISKDNSKENKKNSISSSTEQPKKDIKINKYKLQKKGVIKRRTSDLTLSRASATAIVSQANHARKETIHQRVASSKDVVDNNNNDSSRKIPLRVWIFFWGSLLLFCISFYQAVIRPQLDVEIINNQVWIEDNSGIIVNNTNNENANDSQESDSILISDDTLDLSTVPGVINAFFSYLSNRDFDNTFNLMIPALQRSSEIREHFTAFRIVPFLDWIEWWVLTPYNFQYISTSTYWRDKYSFDLSYTLASSKEKYDETREFVVDTKWDAPKITNIVCTTPKCSYHPIFRPENFGLMK